MKKTILFYCLFFTATFIFGQSRESNLRVATGPAKEGTYQFVFKSRQAEENIQLSNSQLVQLESLRGETQVVLVKVTDFTTIKLFPKSLINDASFIPSTSKIYIVESPDYADLSNVKKIPLE
jgi:hypothetical protein